MNGNCFDPCTWAAGISEATKTLFLEGGRATSVECVR